jgi:hypothetical protein
VLNESENGTIITANSWEVALEPGILLSMAMLLRKQAKKPTEQACPACGKVYKGYGKCKDLQRVRWYAIDTGYAILETSC